MARSRVADVPSISESAATQPEDEEGWATMDGEGVRRRATVALIVLAAVLLLASPLVFLGALEFLPRHGDGMGTIGDALVTAAGCAALGVAAGVGALVLHVGNRRLRRTRSSPPER